MIWYRLERLFGYTSFAVYSLERFNSLLTAAGLGLLYLSSLKFVPPKKAWLLPFFLGGSYAVWHYAVDGYTMGATTFFICLLIWHLTRLDIKKISSRDVAVTAILSFLYIGIHALGAFHALAIAWWFSTSKQESRRPFSKRILDNKGVRYLAILSGLLFISYFSIYFLVVKPTSSRGFLNWVVGYASYYGLDKTFDWYYFDFNILSILKGHWIGWRDALIFPFHKKGIESAATLMVALSTMGLVGWSFINRKTLDKGNHRFYFLLMAWGFLNMFVIGFWGPGFPGFRIHFFFPIFFAVLISLAKKTQFFRSIFVIGCLTFGFNFTGPIYFDSFISNNKGFQLLTEINTHLKKGDMFVCKKGDVPGIEGLRAYFFPHIIGGPLESRLFEFREKSLDPMKEILISKLEKGKSIYLTESLYNQNYQNNIETQFRLEQGEVQFLLDNFNKEIRFQLSNDIDVFQIFPKKS